MNMPFTTNEFLNVFARYNLSVWPAPVFAYLFALAALVLAVRKSRYSDRMISGLLACFWLWMGIVYHLIFFSPINPAAYGFGLLFIAQGVLFIRSGVFKQRISFRFQPDRYAGLGALFILYGLVIYPILGYSLGHSYPQAPTFGLPCPTTIFTFGILLWTRGRLPKILLVIPFVWSVIGFLAALNLGIKEDFGLLAAGLIGASAILLRDRKAGEKGKAASAELKSIA